jgi:hypothetical protein
VTDEAKDAVGFLQDLMVGKLTYDRMDPKHLRQLGAACQLVDDYAVVTRLLPELSQKLAGLKASDKDGADGLGARKKLLEELRAAVGAKIEQLEADIAAAEEQAAKAERASSDEHWAWGEADAKPFDGVVAIDLGTTSVVCAHWNFHASDPDASSNEPVAVNVLDAKGFHRLETGSYRVGEKALRHRNQINLYRSFRRWVGTLHKPRPAVTGSQLLPVVVPDLVGAVVKNVLQTLTQKVSPGGEPMRFPNVVVTVPASGDAAFEYELRRVFERLQVGGSAELDEATAAGVYSLLKPVLKRSYATGSERLTPGEWYAKAYGMAFDGTQGEMHVLCVDFGGGTTDLSLLRFAVLQDSRCCRITIEVAETHGFEQLSGEGLTLYLFDLLKRRLALALADPKRALAGTPTDPLPEHPCREFHEAEGGPAKAMYVPQHLAEDLAKLVANWDTVAGRAPLDADLRRIVDTFFPTAYEEAPRTTKKIRRVNFQTLWDEAERLKREVAQQRAGGSNGASARLDLKGIKRQAKSIQPDAYLRAAGVDPSTPTVPGALAITGEDVDGFVTSRGELLLQTLARICSTVAIHRVLLAGNGANDTRYALTRHLGERAGIIKELVEFHPSEAKTAVAKGACLWALGNRLEGIQVSILRRPRHPSTLYLVSAVRSDQLYKAGERINRFAYAFPSAREGEEGNKLIQIDREVGGEQQAFMMFHPAKQGRLLPSIEDLPIKRRQDLVVGNPDEFLLATETGLLHDFACRDPGQYLQMVDWVSHWEMLELLRKEMTMEEVIAWLESSAALQEEPPLGQAFHRYYMDENRELYLVYHAQGKKLLVEGEVVESARKSLPAELDPFSGVH